MKTSENQSSVELARRLRWARTQRFISRLLRGLLSWVGITLSVVGVIVVLDVGLSLPVQLRLPLGVLAAGVVGWTLYTHVITVFHSFYSLDRAAYELEQEYDIPRNMLINAYQLDRRDLTEEEKQLAQQTIEQGMVWSKRLRSMDLWKGWSLLKVACFATLLIGVWFAGMNTASETVSSALLRYSLPHADVPPAGQVQLRVVPGQDVSLEQGGSHRVLVFVEARKKKEQEGIDDLLSHRPRIVVDESRTISATRSEVGTGVRMSSVPENRVQKLLSRLRKEGVIDEQIKTGDGVRSIDDLAGGVQTAVYEYKFNDLRRSRSFRIFHDPGGTYSKSYRVNVNPIPEIAQAETRITPPQYTGAESRVIPAPSGSIRALPGSEVEVRVVLDVQVEELQWQDPTGKMQFTQQSDKVWEVGTRIKEAGSYRIRSRRTEDSRPRVVSEGNVLAERDEPPHVEFVTDRHNMEAWPGQEIQLEISAEDDFGVSEMALTVERPEGEEDDGKELMRWNLDGPPGESSPESVQHTVRLDPSKFDPGSDYLFRARAKDYHPEGQTSRSKPLLVRVKSPNELSSNEASGPLGLLNKAIEQQRRALSNTGTVSNYMKAVLGEDPDKPKVTFYHHRARMEDRQNAVDRLLGKFSNAAPDEMSKYVKDALKVRDNLVRPVAADIRDLAGNPEPWFGNNNDDENGDSKAKRVVKQGNGWQRVFASPRPSRYAGVRIKEHSGFAISDLEFLDGNGDRIPSPYVTRFHVSPQIRKWEGPVGFVDVKRKELASIVSDALATDLQGGDGPVVRLDGMVDDTPDQGVALYAAREIYTKKPRTVFLYTGSSDSLRVWLNGTLEMKTLQRRKPRPDSDRVKLQLKEGKNVILAEVSADKRSPALAMRFASEDGTKLSLTEDGRLIRATEKEIIHAGVAPEKATNAIDGNKGSKWKVRGNHPVLLIVDAGHKRELSGVRIRTHGNPGNSFDLHLAEELKMLENLPPIIDSVEKRQKKAVDRLVAIRTEWHEHQEQGEQIVESERAESGSDEAAPPAVASEPGMEELVGELLDESERSQELSKQRKSVLDQGGEDFSGDTKKKLEEIKKTEKRVAEKMREIVQDMSQVGNLNTSHATEVSNVQQMRENAEDLAEVNEEKADQEITQITDNLDTAAQELHEELEKQSEVSFGDSSNIQDVQEIAEDKKTPLPMAELPQTLNDLVGEMEEGRKEFDEEAQTKGSMLKSLDADGPIAPGRQSSTSAEGKTGDEPPDAARETEGRSGFGRTGRASGEGVADVAEDIPQDKIVPPDRKTGTSLEEGGVEDRSTEAQAGGTGLGKETDRTGEFGLEGELPDSILNRMRETAGQMKKLRENVSGVVMDLQRHNLSTTRLEEAAEAMERVVKAAEEGNFVEFRRSYNEALDRLSESEESIGQTVGKRLIREREHAEAVGPRRERERSIPGGYEKMVSEYFRTIAEENGKDR